MSMARGIRVRTRLSRASLAPLAALALLFAGCETTDPEGSVALRFDELPYSTVTVMTRSDGSTVESHGGDPDLIGRKEVGLQVGVFMPVTIENIVLTYWAAGNRAGARSFEKTMNQQFTPGSAGPTALIHKFEIPGADRFQQCQGFYYMFSANYRLANGTAGKFAGPPHLIQPTKRVLPDGKVDQASCGPPPGPDE
jgi:hypothetical protein